MWDTSSWWGSIAVDTLVRSVVGHTCADGQVGMCWAAFAVGDAGADAAVAAPGVVVVVVVGEGFVVVAVAVAANAAVVGVASVWMVLAVGLATELVVAIGMGGVVDALRSGSSSVALE